MITRMSLKNIATFTKSVELDNVTKINFFFGSNGTGKTTIAKVIARPSDFGNCSVTWESNLELNTLVFNEDFIKRHFYQRDSLQGIFTMGDGAADIEARIESLKSDIDRFKEDLNCLCESFDKKTTRLSDVQDKFRETCWNVIYQQHKDDFSETFRGFRSSKKRLAEELLKQCSDNGSQVEDLEFLKGRYNLLYREDLSDMEELASIPLQVMKDLRAVETHSILQSKIIGKQDVDIADMIHKLQNHDWVREGKTYYEQNFDEQCEAYICPFCQQKTSEEFKAQLEDYFDKTFKKQIGEFEKLVDKYGQLTGQIEEFFSILDEAKDNGCLQKRREELLRIRERLTDKIASNRIVLKKKQSSPSVQVELQPTSELIQEANEIISVVNQDINERNELVANKEQEKEMLHKEIWRFFCDKLSSNVSQFRNEVKTIKREISDVEQKIKKTEAGISSCVSEIGNLEAKIKSVKPTVESINRILKNFGYKGFRLQATEDEKHYQTVRANGELAKESLSEGERNLIVFLYFYHLIQGVLDPEDNISEDKVVVIDDPVSSLDSDVLFLVATLIKNIVCELRGQNGKDGDGNFTHVKQLWVLTHNVHFFKEVTFQWRNNYKKRKDTMYYVIKKYNNVSGVQFHEVNPIKTTYQLLWEDIKDNDIDNISIQNSMRRIIEFYFNTLANLKEAQLLSAFSDPTERQICRSLLAWTNEGSHSIFDDMNFIQSQQTVEKYVQVFKRIFDETGQIAHYNMMMGIDS